MPPPIPKLILGLDFAPERLAVAEMKRKGNRYELVRNALFPRSFESGASLREALKERGFKAKHVAIGPPAEGTLFRHMFLPSNMRRNIRPFLWTVINHEAPAEAAFDWIDLGAPPVAPEHQLLLVAIVRAVALTRAEDLVRRAGLTPVISTPRNIGFYHLARALGLSDKNRTVLMIDRRDDRVDLALARGDKLLYCRGQAAGRSLPTRQSRMGGADSVARQVETALQHARDQLKEPDLTPAEIYVSGAGASGLTDELSERTGFPCSALDPFETFGRGQTDGAQALDSEECVGAIGVALAGFRRSVDSSLSLTVGRPKTVALDRDLRYYRIAIAVACLAVVAVVFGNYYARNVTKRNAVMVKAHVDGARRIEADLRGRVAALNKASEALVEMATAAAAPEPIAAVLQELSRIIPPEFRIEVFRMQPNDARRRGIVFEEAVRCEVIVSVPPDSLDDKYDEILAIAEGLRTSERLRTLSYRPEGEPATDRSRIESRDLNRPRWKFTFRISRLPK